MDKAELTKLLHKNYHVMAKNSFAENGFKWFKTNDYIRVTDDDIVQWINIQKHSWDTKFTYNIAVFPLFIESDFMYFAFGGIRIGHFEHGCDFWQDYSSETDMSNSLSISLKLIQDKVFPFFDTINSSVKLLKYLQSPNSLFEDYKHMPTNYNKETGLLYLRSGDSEAAYKSLDAKTISDIKNCDTENIYLNNIIKKNYEQFKIKGK